MYQAVEAVWKNGQILPLEPLIVEENAKLMVVVINPQNPVIPDINENQMTKIRSLKGSMRGWTSGVEGFIANKQEEIEREDRR